MEAHSVAWIQSYDCWSSDLAAQRLLWFNLRHHHVPSQCLSSCTQMLPFLGGVGLQFPASLRDHVSIRFGFNIILDSALFTIDIVMDIKKRRV